MFELKKGPDTAIGGYAPGMYGCKCLICGEEYLGAKRSFHCHDCATTAAKQYIETISKNEFNDPVTIETVTLENYQVDPLCNGAVNAKMGKTEFIRLLISERQAMVRQLIDIYMNQPRTTLTDRVP